MKSPIEKDHDRWVAHADVCITYYAAGAGVDIDAKGEPFMALTDLLTNLMHWSDEHAEQLEGKTFEQAYISAKDHYGSECMEREEAAPHG